MINNFIVENNNPISIDEKSLWFVFHKDELLLNQDKSKYSIPQKLQIGCMDIKDLNYIYLGKYKNIECYCLEISNLDNVPDKMIFNNLRKSYALLEEALFQISGYAFQIMKWNQTFQYCGRCGVKTHNMETERAKICPECELVNYPKVSPAIIVAIIKENKILLARAKHFPEKMQSVLAGFVEPGESLEECVKREVKEEVNIEVKNIQYFGSQSWPFTESLMIGFTAEYKSGEIKVDENELVEAAWYSKDNIPHIPGKLSIAGHLIDWFVEKS